MNYEYEGDDDDEIAIDQNDLIIIYDKDNWRPTKQYILAYAEQLGFDIENDPPELLEIAEKYLTAEIPDEYCRAFHKSNLELLYINMRTNDIELKSGLEAMAIEEYKKAKEKIKNEENKIKVIPRKKIAPIGSNKALKDPKIEKEKEFLKKVDNNFKEKEKNKNRISNEIKKEDKQKKFNESNDEEEDEYDYSEKKYEITSKQKKDNNNDKNNNKDSQKDFSNLKDSGNIIKNFDNSFSDEDEKSIEPITSKKNINLKKEKSVENMKMSNEIEKPSTIEENKYNSINPRYQRSNKKRQNLRYDRKSLEMMKEEIALNKLKEKNNNEINIEDNNDNNISNDSKNKSIKLNKSDNSNDSNDLEKLKNNYIEKIKNDFKKFKSKIKNNYIKNKKSFIEEYINELESKNSKEIKKMKKEKSEIFSTYENELNNKMNQELENYRKELIKERNKNSEELRDKTDEEISLEIQFKKLESNIRIQKEKNRMKKELLEQKKKNEMDEDLKLLGQNHKKEMLNLEKESKNKIDILKNEFQTNFILYQKEFKLKNNNNIYINDIQEKNNNLLKEDLIIYEKELKQQFDESIKILKEEWDNKLMKEIEIFKENINKENNEGKINRENKDLEKEYFIEINELKQNNKIQIKKIEDTIKNLFEKTTNSFDKIKNKSTNDINGFIFDIKKKVKDIFKNENNNDNYEAIINEFLSEIITKKILILNKYSSFVDIAEEEYKQNNILIEYFIEIIRMINEIITENNQKNNNTSINHENLAEFSINEILHRINDMMEEFKNKYENKQNNRLYPLLYDAIQKLINLKFNEEIDFGSPRLNPLINSNQNITNVNYLNYMNNSQMNESNFNNNNIIFSNRTINNINQKIDESEKTINNINNNQIYSPKKNPMNNSSLYINPQTQRNNYSFFKNNNTLNQSSFRHNNNIFPIKEDIESNKSSIYLNSINIPQIPNEILNNFSSENIRNYKVIIDFLVSEYKQIYEENNIYINRNNANQKLNMLKESGEYIRYNHIFEQINKQENDENEQYLKDIESKKNILELIKNNCEESFNFIIKYNNKSNIINNKLGVLIKHIEDYNNHFKTKNNNAKYFSNKRYNIENVFNNTFQIERNNYNQPNILNSNTFSNYFEKNRKFNNTYNSFRY